MNWLADGAPDSEFQWLTSHLSHGQVLIVGCILGGLFVFTRIVEGSEKIAKYVPLVGKKLRERGEKREKNRADQMRTQAEAVISEMEPPDYGDKIATLEGRIEVLEQRDDVTHDFHVYDESWHREDELERTESGLPIRHRLTFRDFAAKWYAGMRFHNGLWHDLKENV